MYLGQNGITAPSVFGETRIVGEHEGQKCFIGDETLHGLNGTSGSVVITWEQSTVSADNRRGKKSSSLL